MMEFRLDEGQVELSDTVARFCADRFPLDAVADREGEALDRAVWSELAGLGVLGLVLDEGAGGVGLGAVEAAIVFEQLGSHLAPGPVVWSMAAAGIIDGVVTGETVVAGVRADDVEHGTAIVSHGGDADVIVVLHRDRVEAHPVADLPEPGPLHALDPLVPVHRVDGLTAGDVVGGEDVAERFELLGRVLSASMLSGLASRSVEVASGYALERQQFDVPIGSFQAVKHLLADMYVRASCAQSSSYAAAAVLDDPGSDEPAIATARAKLLATDAAIENASTAIQVLGGMGFTWDMLPNHLLKRAWNLEHEFGTRAAHSTELGAAVGARR